MHPRPTARPAVESMCRFVLWLVPTVEKFPRRQKFPVRPPGRFPDGGVLWRAAIRQEGTAMYRCTGALTPALVLFPILAVDARAELLLEVDGVELHGTARLVASRTSTCNVLESDTSYEEKKANHGAPMDVWRLDFSVHNRTGRWLDHLIAQYEIASQWPACTNWSRPEGLDVFVSVEWAGAIGTIQETGRNVVPPEAVLTETRHLIVLRGDPQPRFSRWRIVDFDLGAGGDAGPGPQAVEAVLGLDRATRRQIQLGLQAAGFDPGGADGLFGPRTRAAIRGWQAGQGARATGYLTGVQVEALRGGGGRPPQATDEVARVAEQRADAAQLGAPAGEIDAGSASRPTLESGLRRLAAALGVGNVSIPGRLQAESGGGNATERPAGGTSTDDRERPRAAAERPRAVPSDHCTKQRVMRLGVLTSSIDSGATLEFTNSRMVMVRAAGAGASLRQETEYSVTADAITYRVVRAVGTAPGFGTRDVPISNPGPHTLACSLSGGVLRFGDGTWR